MELSGLMMDMVIVLYGDFLVLLHCWFCRSCIIECWRFSVFVFSPKFPRTEAPLFGRRFLFKFNQAVFSGSMRFWSTACGFFGGDSWKYLFLCMHGICCVAPRAIGSRL